MEEADSDVSTRFKLVLEVQVASLLRLGPAAAAAEITRVLRRIILK